MTEPDVSKLSQEEMRQYIIDTLTAEAAGEEIDRTRLTYAAEMLHAVGLLHAGVDIEDIDALLDRPHVIRLSVQPDGDVQIELDFEVESTDTKE